MKKIRFLLPVLLAVLQLQAQVPVLNSYPSAKATVLLDFDGQMVRGTGWNGIGELNLAPANLTPEQITEVFNRVAEDYRPFNLNITTDSSVYWAAPAKKRMRIILTVTSQWYGNAGGISFIGSFNWGDNTPAFVFTALLGLSAKNVGEAASHEIGHTLGLRHQSAYDVNCRKLTEYNPGAGAGEIGWAPIMGVSYYRNFTLWNNGANPFGCTFYQDDLGIISGSMNGFGFREDDHGNTPATATAAKFFNRRFSVDGVIEKITDRDVVRFIMPATMPFHLDAMPYSIASGSNGSDLDMQVDILDSDSNVVGSYNPESLLGISVDTILHEGTYYLRVQGRGNMFAPEYASLGSYRLSASLLSTFIQPLHKLELAGSAAGGIHHLSWTIESDESIEKLDLLVSKDGRNFSTLTIPLSTDRSFEYAVSVLQQCSYKLLVTLTSGRKYVSNILVLGTAVNVKPDIHTQAAGSVLTITSTKEWNYQICDYQGRILSKGRLRTGTQNLETGRLGAGMYIISFSDGSQIFSEKFIKP